jgi:NADPH:quinone reductase-like Zn-dependent oxidoreductase
MDVGGEGTGRLLAVGSDVHDLHVGQPVIMLGRQNWREQLRVPAESVIPLPEGIDVFQRAMLKTNPGTAWSLLHAGPRLEQGDWVIQTAGNSALGRIFIRMARRLGFRTISIVRREDAVGVCEAAGGHVVLVDGPSLKDAVGGPQARCLVECLADGGHYVVYGFLGGDTLTLDIKDLLFRRISVSGLASVYALPKNPHEIRTLYAQLSRMLSDGDITTPVDAVYEMADIRQAITHAMRGDRMGKVLVKTQFQQ